MGDARSASEQELSGVAKKPAVRVVDIIKKGHDHIGDDIVDVFSSNAPYYAIYRTPTRLVVQYADEDQFDGDKKLADVQRTRVSPLAPLRGQINGLIDGWHSAALPKYMEEDPAVIARPGTLAGVWDWFLQFLPSRQREARRAFYYDRRVADALIVLLDDPGALETSQTLLTQIKNDIITERTTIARTAYLRWAIGLAALLIALCALLASPGFAAWHPFRPEVARAWSAVAGGSAGAFFSLVIGLKGRNLTIDLQSRENVVDVVTRMLVGAIAGGVFYTLVATEVVQTSIFKIDVPPARSWGYFDLTVFLMGFVAGFLERLVPDLLNATNFASAEPTAATGTPLSPTAKSPPPPPPPPAGEGGAASEAGETADEACLCDGAPTDGEAVTPDHELPVAEGGVAEADPADIDPAAPVTDSAAPAAASDAGTGEATDAVPPASGGPGE